MLLMRCRELSIKKRCTVDFPYYVVHILIPFKIGHSCGSTTDNRQTVAINYFIQYCLKGLPTQ